MNRFEQGLLKYLSQTELEKIQFETVGICGAGGLGSNCAQNLVRCGFRKFVIADDDRIEPSNLNRQFFFENQIGGRKTEMLKENLIRINPNVQIELYNDRIDKRTIVSVFQHCSILVEACDEPESKTVIIEAFLTGMVASKYLVSASGISGWGHPDRIRVRQVRPRLFIIGDMVTQADENHPPLSPKVVLAAAKQADVILQLVLGRWNNEKDV